ncbi:MAG: MlaD family protein [bacterium]|nr:MlaD family protein [bacterium]
MRPELKVGIFVTTGLLILAGLIMSIGEYHFYRSGYTITVIFSDVGGLEVDAPVRLAGLEVGEVKKMEIKDSKVYAALWLNSFARLRRDSRVTINSLGMMGEKYIDITMGSPDAPYLPEGSTVIGEDPVSVGELLLKGEKITGKLSQAVTVLNGMLKGGEALEDLSVILKETRGITTKLNQTLAGNEGKISATFDHLQELSVSLKEESAQITRGIREIERDLQATIKENRGDIRIAVKQFKDASGQLQNIMNENRDDLRMSTQQFREASLHLKTEAEALSSRINSLLEDIDKVVIEKGGELNSALVNFKEASTKLAEASAGLKHAAHQLQEGEGLLGGLLYDEKMKKEFMDTISAINTLIKDIEQHPWKLLRK